MHQRGHSGPCRHRLLRRLHAGAQPLPGRSQRAVYLLPAPSQGRHRVHRRIRHEPGDARAERRHGKRGCRLSGRLKRYFLHIKNGIQKKIFSLDIEKVLLKHPKVDNCAVVPKSDETTFQVPVAYIILKKESRSSQDIESEFVAYAEEHLSDGYRPVKYYFVDKFPLTKIGKVDYRALEEENHI